MSRLKFRANGLIYSGSLYEYNNGGTKPQHMHGMKNKQLVQCARSTLGCLTNK